MWQSRQRPPGVPAGWSECLSPNATPSAWQGAHIAPPPSAAASGAVVAPEWTSWQAAQVMPPLRAHPDCENAIASCWYVEGRRSAKNGSRNSAFEPIERIGSAATTTDSPYACAGEAL